MVGGDFVEFEKEPWPAEDDDDDDDDDARVVAAREHLAEIVRKVNDERFVTFPTEPDKA